MSATTPARVNFGTILKNVDGSTIRMTEAEGAPDVTLGFICLDAIRVPLPEDRGMSIETLMELGALATAISAALKGEEAMIMEPHEVQLLAERIRQTMLGRSPLLAHAAIAALDPTKIKQRRAAAA